jgi:hypothetical protein
MHDVNCFINLIWKSAIQIDLFCVSSIGTKYNAFTAANIENVMTFANKILHNTGSSCLLGKAKFDKLGAWSFPVTGNC